MNDAPLRLTFDGGTVVVTGGRDEDRANLPGVALDPRTRTQRAEGRNYRAIVEYLIARKIPYEDAARDYKAVCWTITSDRTPFPHQTEAVAAWWKAGGRGLVVLPTGTGKTFAAMLAIRQAGRPTLVVTPTIADYAEHVWHLYVIQARNRDGLQAYLREQRIGNAIHYPIPLHQQPAYRDLGYQSGDFPVTERAADTVLSLPMYPELPLAALERVADAVKGFVSINGNECVA